jgi:hypothetical protein
MIRHVVMFKFKDSANGAPKDKNMTKAQSLLEALPEKISEIKNLEIHYNLKEDPANYDMLLIVDLDSLDDLAVYIDHPDHKKVGEFIGKVRDSRLVVDYEM